MPLEINAQLDQVQHRLQHLNLPNVEVIRQINEYIFSNPGKLLRPRLLLLCASVHTDGHPSPIHLQWATACELLHNATLLHDDVVDESPMRRKRPSVCRQWNNRTAVLCGDYYLTQVLTLFHETRNSGAMHIISDAILDLTCGELIQQQLITSNRTPTPEQYIEIIRCKTASLMATCCALGAIRTPGGIPEETPDEQILPFKNFGTHYGLAFQIHDDIVDYPEDLPATHLPLEALHPLLEKHLALAEAQLALMPECEARTELHALCQQLRTF